jgi:hypothetical protein
MPAAPLLNHDGENKLREKYAKWRLTEPRNPHKSRGRGPMAEWLRRGLQILARRFDSGSGLHISGLASRPIRG